MLDGSGRTGLTGPAAFHGPGVSGARGVPGVPGGVPGPQSEFLSRAARARLGGTAGPYPAPGAQGHSGGHADADATAVIPQAGPADATAVLPTVGPADATAVLPQAGPADATQLLSSARPAPAVRDPWAETGGVALPDPGAAPDAGATHDPHEVTVQLDAVQLGAGGLRPAGGTPLGTSENSDGPVFVDESGRRSRTFRRLGILIGLACAVYAVVIVATLVSGNSSAPWLPVPDQKKQEPAGEVDTTPLPGQSAQPSGSPGVSPGASASASDGATPSPGASTGTAPGATTGSGGPATTADPAPTATRSTPGTAGGGGTVPNPGTSVPPKASEPATEPTPPTQDPVTSPTPTETATTGTGDSGGTGTVADGPSDPTPLTQSPAEDPGSVASSSPALASDSPENTL
ncbi:hypothetical protein [Streptomyces griseosporeus]|uniref:hypothetical protein n=1 Tax=Streptomyces griseosporeus TaxID=1910 RepID=UPI0036FF3641